MTDFGKNIKDVVIKTTIAPTDRVLIIFGAGTPLAQTATITLSDLVTAIQEIITNQ